jgi:hypothetical protein
MYRFILSVKENITGETEGKYVLNLVGKSLAEMEFVRVESKFETEMMIMMMIIMIMIIIIMIINKSDKTSSSIFILIIIIIIY